MADDLILPFRLSGLEKALADVENVINLMQNKANRLISQSQLKTGRFGVGINTDTGEITSLVGKNKVPAELATFQVDAAKVERTRLRSLMRVVAAQDKVADFETKYANNIQALLRQQTREGITGKQGATTVTERVTTSSKDFAYKLEKLRNSILATESAAGVDATEFNSAKQATLAKLLDIETDFVSQMAEIRAAEVVAEEQRAKAAMEASAAVDRKNRIAAERNATKMEKENKAKLDAAARQVKQAKREADREGSQQLMGLASAGIGIMGQAGFPLLNVAFASMSGMKYAGIAAIATAAGEGARAIMRLQDAATAAAESLGAVGISAKMAKGEYEAAKAFYGVMQQSAQSRMYTERTDMLKGGSVGASFPWMYAANVRTNLSNAFVHPLNALNAFGAAFKQTGTDYAGLPGGMREARNSMYRQLNQYNARIEGPEQMWQRIQTAAASPADENRRVALKQLETMDRLIKSMDGVSETASKIIAWLPDPSWMSGVGILSNQYDAMKGAANWVGSFFQ